MVTTRSATGSKPARKPIIDEEEGEEELLELEESKLWE